MGLAEIIVTAVVGAFCGIGTNFFVTWLTSVFSEKAERKIRIREEMVWLENVISDTKEQAVDYWTIGFHNHTLAASIIGRIKFISDISYDLIQDNSAEPLNNFEDACTSGNFQTKEINAEPHRAATIEITAYKLISTIRRSRREI